MPDDTRTQAIASAASDHPEPSYSLRVLEGANAGASIRIGGPEGTRVLIGQSPACDLRLDDRTVSRRHLALERVADDQGGCLRLTDLGSSNGTRVNGVSVIEALLHGGERLCVGATVLLVGVEPTESGNTTDLRTCFGGLIGSSPQMRQLYPRCDRLAQSTLPVLIEGETGTGKEVLAEALHAAGPRATKPFVVFDCTTVNPNLVEAALFGHERGAFTGASEARPGVFEAADGGTVLLDEIGDLDLPLQAKLLRAIERSEVQRVGSARRNQVDVRVIAATRRDLDRLIQDGRFRDDLFFRVVVGRIELPPLRHRSGDVAVLAEHFWRTLGGAGPIPYELLQRFEGYAFPGNVRELRNAVARYCALGEIPGAAPAIGEPEDAFEEVLALDLPFAHARQRVLEAFQRRYVERLVERHDGNVTQAARASGLALRYFQLLRARHRGE